MEIPDHVADMLLRSEVAVRAAQMHLWRAEQEAAVKELPDQKENVDMVRMLCKSLAEHDHRVSSCQACHTPACHPRENIR